MTLRWPIDPSPVMGWRTPDTAPGSVCRPGRIQITVLHKHGAKHSLGSRVIPLRWTHLPPSRRPSPHCPSPGQPAPLMTKYVIAYYIILRALVDGGSRGLSWLGRSKPFFLNFFSLSYFSSPNHSPLVRGWPKKLATAEVSINRVFRS